MCVFPNIKYPFATRLTTSTLLSNVYISISMLYLSNLKYPSTTRLTTSTLLSNVYIYISMLYLSNLKYHSGIRLTTSTLLSNVYIYISMLYLSNLKYHSGIRLTTSTFCPAASSGLARSRSSAMASSFTCQASSMNWRRISPRVCQAGKPGSR